MAKRSILRTVWHCLVSCQASRKNAQRPTVKAHPKSQEVAGTQLCSSCSCFAHDRGQRIGELVTGHIKSYDEMKRADCLICSILCEGLEQYSKDQDSFPTGILLQIQEGIVQLHISREHPDYLGYEVCFDFELFRYKRTRGENLKHCCRPAYNLQSTFANNHRKPIPIGCIWARK